MTRETGLKGFRIGAAVASGLLLWDAFPPHAQADCAWIALVPLFLVIRRSAPGSAFRWAWLSGLVFWVLTLGWFPAIIKNEGPWALVLLGQLGLSAWCALFLAVYAAASARVWRWAGPDSGWRRLVAVTVMDPLMWGGAEWVRGWLFSGFAWNFLGVSQVGNLPMIQVASVAGVYGVSALLVLVNGAITGVAERAAAPFIARFRRQSCQALPFAGRLVRSAESFVPLALVIGCWIWGIGRVNAWRADEKSAAQWRVALIQPNAPCIFTRNDESMRTQVGVMLNQTRLAGAAKPDVVIWPETAAFGSVPGEAQTLKLVRDGAGAGGAPLLTGVLETEAVEKSPSAPEGFHFYNAAWLFSPAGEAMGRYRKRHLVPFGEYIPFDKALPFLQRLAPTGISCTPGVGPGILTVARPGGGELRMGPMICFEDTVPGLSREAVRAGAGLLVLMTNDAWFNGSIEPVQHLNQSVFRAVENGVPLVRAANSGVSCVVDAVGRTRRLESAGAVSDFAGFFVTQVAVSGKPLPSPYTRWGDGVFALPGVFVLLAVLGSGVVFRKGSRA